MLLMLSRQHSRVLTPNWYNQDNIGVTVQVSLNQFAYTHTRDAANESQFRFYSLHFRGNRIRNGRASDKEVEITYPDSYWQFSPRYNGTKRMRESYPTHGWLQPPLVQNPVWGEDRKKKFLPLGGTIRLGSPSQYIFDSFVKYPLPHFVISQYHYWYRVKEGQDWGQDCTKERF